MCIWSVLVQYETSHYAPGNPSDYYSTVGPTPATTYTTVQTATLQSCKMEVVHGAPMEAVSVSIGGSHPPSLMPKGNVKAIHDPADSLANSSLDSKQHELKAGLTKPGLTAEEESMVVNALSPDTLSWRDE